MRNAVLISALAASGCLSEEAACEIVGEFVAGREARFIEASDYPEASSATIETCGPLLSRRAEKLWRVDLVVALEGEFGEDTNNARCTIQRFDQGWVVERCDYLCGDDVGSCSVGVDG